MIAGHFATALVPYELTRKSDPVPVWLFLLAAQFLDVLMMVFVSLGHREDGTRGCLRGLVQWPADRYVRESRPAPRRGWAALFGVATWLIWRKPVIALWCVGLVAFHEVCDLIVGYPHEVVRGVGPIGMALYVNAPILSFLIQAAMAAGIVFWFCRRRANGGQPVSTGTQVILYAVLVGTTLATLPLANNSINSLLGL